MAGKTYLEHVKKCLQRRNLLKSASGTRESYDQPEENEELT
jgi:hypothetical protein